MSSLAAFSKPGILGATCAAEVEAEATAQPAAVIGMPDTDVKVAKLRKEKCRAYSAQNGVKAVSTWNTSIQSKM